jgi:hypothetical protein
LQKSDVAVTARACTTEVRGSNPLSSTRKSGRPDVISYAIFGSFIDWRGSPTVHSAATKLGLVPRSIEILVEPEDLPVLR